jgi:hypothetical protein
MDWKEILERDDIVGGDIEAQDSGDVYRGPIESITMKGDAVSIKSTWMAKLPGGIGSDSGWEKWHITQMSFSINFVTPQDIGDGRILFQIPGLGVTTIFPKGGSKLDPAKVRGLDLD